MAYFVKSTRSIGLTQSVLHFNFKSGSRFSFAFLHIFDIFRHFFFRFIEEQGGEDAEDGEDDSEDDLNQPLVGRECGEWREDAGVEKNDNSGGDHA
jgi:hypothetical protein